MRAMARSAMAAVVNEVFTAMGEEMADESIT